MSYPPRLLVMQQLGHGVQPVFAHGWSAWSHLHQTSPSGVPSKEREALDPHCSANGPEAASGRASDSPPPHSPVGCTRSGPAGAHPVARASREPSRLPHFLLHVPCSCSQPPQSAGRGCRVGGGGEGGDNRGVRRVGGNYFKVQGALRDARHDAVRRRSGLGLRTVCPVHGASCRTRAGVRPRA